jgi:hypothetical protein
MFMQFSNTYSQDVYEFSPITFLLKFHERHYRVFRFSLLTVVFYYKFFSSFTEAKLLKFLILRIAFPMYGRNIQQVCKMKYEFEQ